MTTSQTTASIGPDSSDGDVDATVSLDRRTARGQRTRHAVVDALLALQEDGVLTPSAQRDAVQAGVALRAVFGHFSDMETLWAEAGARELEKLGELAVPIDPTLPLADRIELFCASRARTLEALLPVMRAARLREHTSAALTRNRELFIAAGDDELTHAFAAELPLLGPDSLHALYLVAAAGGWESLRLDRGLGVEPAADLMRRIVTRLIDPSGGQL
ncbi:MAG: TetR/AcrR family transcriptional regulator [Frankiales bacterium]|nr:TetR/AcrR family transcriptional regulator [Frankiales bacterium]